MAKRASDQMTWYDAVLHVLKEKGEAMHYADIADAIVKEKLRDNVGATPNQTVSVVLNYSLKHEGAASPFVRVSRGIYGLSGRKGSSPSEQKEVEDAALTEPAADEEVPAIGAFGMYWRRDLVRWPGTTVHLMGRQSDTSKPVDFSNQVGVYLLHDRDRIIYVGRVDTNERLGTRLREHTKGRLAYRWDRFSWFGLRRPTREGKLEPFQRELAEADLVGLMESILIEAIEPGLNRKRGEGLRSVEFYQAEDPSLQKDKKRTLLLEIMQQFAGEEMST
jgi:hypothetical protein